MPKKILVVEDERQIAKLIEINLRKADFEVIVAYDGEEALKMIEEQNPDIMVLDDFLPKLKGPDLMKKLGEDPKRVDEDRRTIIRPRVVTLWQRHDDASQFEAWQLGTSAHHTKPFSPHEILKSVRTCAAEFSAEEEN